MHNDLVDLPTGFPPQQPAARPTSRLSIIGLVLSVLAPPVGFVVSIVSLVRLKKTQLSGKTLSIIGIALGAVLSIPLIIIVAALVAISSYVSKPNQAEIDLKPLIASIQRLGGQEICYNGDNGYGIDNRVPWYTVYYSIDHTPDLTKLEQSAAQLGYPLVDNKTSPNPYSDSRLLVSNQPKGQLSVTIDMGTAVPLRCSSVPTSQYGAKRATSPDNPVMTISLILPSTKQP